jgi:pyruvate-formate lyase
LKPKEVLPLIDRINELKQIIYKKRLEGSLELPPPHWYYLEGFVAAIDEPFEIREAKARLNFYRNVPIHITPGEVIVGQVDWNEPLVSLVSNTHIRADVLDKNLTSVLPVQEKEKMAEWVEIARPFCFDPWPHLTEEERLVHSSHLAPSTFFNGHTVPDYGYVLNRGLNGIMQDIERYRSRPMTDVERNFYDAMEITVQGLSIYISRYADLAEAIIRDNTPGYDQDQLRHILTICRHIAWEPAQSFAQALQLMWFMMCFVDYDSFGRFDQYMLPYYEFSRDQGMGEEESLLWMAYTCFKIEECGAILNMTLGGRKEDGSSAVNRLTILAMQVTRSMGFRSPNLSLRIRSTDPDELWREAHVTLATGQGLPAIYNDDLIVPMLLDMGYPEREAMDYGLAGCSQVILPGRCNFACDVGCYNLLKALELALHDGYDILIGKQVGPHSGKVGTLETFEALKQVYTRQRRFMTRVGVSINDKDMYLRQREGACVRSLLTRDCLERGRGIFHGGARFYNIENEACGITNTANALYAIKKLVFEEKILSLERLVAILDSDWEGQEKLKLTFQNRSAKFGNDDAEVDAIRAQISKEWYKEIQQYPAVLGGFHWPGEVVFVYHELHGAHTGASADGRKCGEPLANSAGASSGSDVSGPTALMNSMLKIPQNQCRTCCVLNLRFSKKMWTRDPSAVITLMRTYFTRGGYQMQINLVNREDLIAARKKPELYADLIVRVGGFSDYYVRLSESLQEEILERTEHEV